MQSNPYRFEIWLRWGFLVALFLSVGFSFYGYPVATRMPTIQGQRQVPQCRVQISRDLEHTASLGMPALESMARQMRSVNAAIPVTYRACAADKSLKTVHVRQNCDPTGGGPLSHAVSCP